MRREKIFSVIICILFFGGALIVRYSQSVVPYWRCSEVYKRYSNVEGVNATYIKNYRVSDTLTVAVSLLEATDSTGWAMLQKDLAITPIPPEVAAIMDTGDVEVWLVSKQDYSRRDTAVLNSDLIVMQYFRRTIAIFELESREQLEDILYYQSREITKSN